MAEIKLCHFRGPHHRWMSPNATLWREIDALGGSSYVGDKWTAGYTEALTHVLAILERRGISEETIL